MTISLPTPTLSLTPASDTGVSHTDGVTDDNVPVFYGTASPGALVTLTDATSGLSVTAKADKYGNYVATFAGLDAGAHALTATSMDANGNVSPASNPYNIDIETQASATITAPSVPETADSVNFQVHFDQPVSAITPASFMLVTTGDAHGNVETVAGSGEDYTVTVAGLGGTGTVGLVFSADDAPTDLAGNEITLASELHEVANTTAGVTTVVSTDQATGAPHQAADAAVSGGGRVVAFISPDETLVPGVQTTPGVANLYVKDLQTGTVVQVTNGNYDIASVQISADGSTVAFSSMATNLVPGGTAPDQLNLYVAKLSSALSSGGLSLVPGSIQLIGKLDDSVELDPDGDGFALSGDGSTLAYQGDSTTPGAPVQDDIDYLVNLNTGTQSQFATNGNITSISLDGTEIAYEAEVEVPGTGGQPDPYFGGTFPPNYVQDAIVYNTTTGTSITIDGSGLLPGTNPPLGPGEEPDYLTAYPVLSGDGSTVVFQLQRNDGQISLFSVNLANPSVFSPVSPGASSNGGTDDDYNQSVSQGGGVIAYMSEDDTTNTTAQVSIEIYTPSTQTTISIGGGVDPVLTTQGNAVVYKAPLDDSNPNSAPLVYETTLGVSASIGTIDGDDAVDAAELKQAATSGLAASGTTNAPAGSNVLLYVLSAVPGAVRSASFNGVVNDDGTWTATIPAAIAGSLTDGTYALFVQILAATGASAKTSRRHRRPSAACHPRSGPRLRHRARSERNAAHQHRHADD
jgi:Tol biopolymer transport system component